MPIVASLLRRKASSVSFHGYAAFLLHRSTAMTAMHPSMLSTLAPGAGGRAASSSAPEMAEGFLKYSDASPTPFHAVATSCSMLEKAGFKRLKESEIWDGGVEKGGKYL